MHDISDHPVEGHHTLDTSLPRSDNLNTRCDLSLLIVEMTHRSRHRSKSCANTHVPDCFLTPVCADAFAHSRHSESALDPPS